MLKEGLTNKEKVTSHTTVMTSAGKEVNKKNCDVT